MCSIASVGKTEKVIGLTTIRHGPQSDMDNMDSLESKVCGADILKMPLATEKPPFASPHHAYIMSCNLPPDPTQIQ